MKTIPLFSSIALLGETVHSSAANLEVRARIVAKTPAAAAEDVLIPAVPDGGGSLREVAEVPTAIAVFAGGKAGPKSKSVPFQRVMLADVARRLGDSEEYGRAQFVEISSIDSFSLREVRVYNSIGINIALGKEASTTGASMSNCPDSSTACPGALVDDILDRSVTIGPKGVWKVDLGAEIMDITYVKIYTDAETSAGLTNKLITFVAEDDSIIKDYDMGDMTDIYERVFEMSPALLSTAPYLDRLYQIAMGDSGLSADFSPDATKNIAMQFQVGRGRGDLAGPDRVGPLGDIRHVLYAKECENKDPITGLVEVTDYQVTATIPSIGLLGMGHCKDSATLEYGKIGSATKASDPPNEEFPFSSTVAGCLQFCSILPNQGNQIGMELKFPDDDLDRVMPVHCECLYEKGSHPLEKGSFLQYEDIPPYATSVEPFGSGEIDSADGTENFDCYPFEGINSGMDKLEISYDFDMTKITGSNIWNEADEKIELCQVIQMMLADDITIAREVKRTIIVDLNLSPETSLSGGALAEETIGVNTELTGFADSVSAYKCDGPPDFVLNEESLGPSNALTLCIVSEDSDNLEISGIAFVTITQDDNAFRAVKTDDITGDVTLSGLTTVEYFNEGAQAVVKTGLPLNLFQFSPGKTIDVAIVTELAIRKGDRRMLQADSGANLSDPNTEDVTFNLVIDLQPSRNARPKEVTMNSAKGTAGERTVVIVVSLIASAFALL